MGNHNPGDVNLKKIWVKLWPDSMTTDNIHYSDVIMSAMASQITGVSSVCSYVCSSADQRKHQSSASLAFVRGNHRLPANSRQRDNNAENVSIWWRHHVNTTIPTCVRFSWDVLYSRNPSHHHGLSEIRTWISNHTHDSMWDVFNPFTS